MVKYRATSSTDRISKKRNTNPIDAIGVPGGNRTHSLSLRRRLRYPITLREHFIKFYTDFYTDNYFT